MPVCFLRCWCGSNRIELDRIGLDWVRRFGCLVGFPPCFVSLCFYACPIWVGSSLGLVFFSPAKHPLFSRTVCLSTCPILDPAKVCRAVSDQPTNEIDDNDSNDQHHRSQRQSPSDRLTVCLDRSIHPSIHQLIHGTFPTFNTRVRLFIPFQSIPLHST